MHRPETTTPTPSSASAVLDADTPPPTPLVPGPRTVAEHPVAAEHRTIQDWSTYTEEDHAVWKILVERRMDTLATTGSRLFLEGAETIGLSADGVPDLEDVNARLARSTGWAATPVAGFVPADQFFRSLGERLFPTTVTLRSRQSIDYTDQPDIFHDVFGHVPLHAHPVFADFLQEFGRAASEAEHPDDVALMANLFWFTVEFGLIAEDGETKIYGSGLVSSVADAAHALGPECDRRRFDLDAIAAQPVVTSEIQQVLFVVESFDQLFEAVEEARARVRS